ncbi:unnamed protein product [Ectocarpus sp. 4 AP-2014]
MDASDVEFVAVHDSPGTTTLASPSAPVYCHQDSQVTTNVSGAATLAAANGDDDNSPDGPAAPAGGAADDTRHPSFEPFRPKSFDSQLGHGLGGLLLGSRSASKKSSQNFAASTKSTMVSGLGVLAKAAKASATTVDDGYVAMSTPCESPVNKATGSCGGPAFPSSSGAAPFKPSASSRAGLAARLGSALQYWASSSADATPPREGRPGPLGARYTQQQRRSKTPEQGIPRAQDRRSAMPTTPPSYQQLPSGPQPANPSASRQGRVDTDEGKVAQVIECLGSADEAATAVAAPSSSHAEALLPGLRDGAPEKGTERAAAGGASAETQPAKGGARKEILIEEKEKDVQERWGKQEEAEAEEEVSGEEGLGIAQKQENDQVQVADLSPFEEQHTGATDGERTAIAVAGVTPHAPVSGSTTADAAGEWQQLQEQVDGGAEAGAGSTRATATTAERTPCSPAASAMSTSAPGEQSTHTAERWGGRNRETSGEIKTEDRGKERETKTKKVGLWELKAERSRLEHALVEAEADRDVERARATEAADRVEEAIARLESLRRRCGVEGAVGTGEAAAAAGLVA